MHSKYTFLPLQQRILEHNKKCIEATVYNKQLKLDVKEAAKEHHILAGLEFLTNYFYQGLAKYEDYSSRLDLSGIMGQTDLEFDEWLEIEQRVREWIETEATTYKYTSREEYGIYYVTAEQSVRVQVRQITQKIRRLVDDKIKICKLPYYRYMINEWKQNYARAYYANGKDGDIEHLPANLAKMKHTRDLITLEYKKHEESINQLLEWMDNYEY
jgi:hypothetical protein